LTGVVNALACLARGRVLGIRCYRGSVQRLSTAAGTMSTLNVIPVLDALERLGIDSARVLALAGMTGDEIRAANARVPATFEFTFWDAIVEHTQDRMIGLRLAEHIQVGAFEGYEYLLRTSQTIRAAVEQANKFERLLDDTTRMSIVESEHEAAIRYGRVGGWPHCSYGIECLFGSLVRLGKLISPDLPVLGVHFAHAAHGDICVYRAFFGCPVTFDAPHCEVVLRRAAIDVPVPTADPVLSRVLEEHLTHVLEHLPTEDAFVQRARRLLGDALQQQTDISLEQLARALHMGERTLRRRLEDHGTSYKNLLDELRRELACHYVARTEQSFEETGARLGFADISAFYRAFKRWTSTTPAAYRAQGVGRPQS
jgi:AraC-like DNA-binding protein